MRHGKKKPIVLIINVGDSFDSNITQMKQSYIEYALFHYHFKSRISVWILNYIKSHTELLEHVHFVNQRIFNHKTLELALTNTDAPAIRLVKNNHLLINTNEIFEYVTTHQNDFDILIHFQTNTQ